MREAEVARVTLFVGHVADGIDVDEKAYARDDQKHDERELIENETEIDVQRADADPWIRAGFGIGKAGRPAP